MYICSCTTYLLQHSRCVYDAICIYIYTCMYTHFLDLDLCQRQEAGEDDEAFFDTERAVMMEQPLGGWRHTSFYIL